MVLIIDNYDSFAFNLYQYIGEMGWEPLVFRNDKITPRQIEKLGPTHIIISPGPCTPLEAGISNEVVIRFSGIIPILGICLGHQCIGHVFGGKIIRAPLPTHGKSSVVHHDAKTIFQGLPSPLQAGRYHSLIVEKKSLPPELKISASTKDGIIMGIRHEKFHVEGVQFHPESILTPLGHDILRNFLGDRGGQRR